MTRYTKPLVTVLLVLGLGTTSRADVEQKAAPDLTTAPAQASAVPGIFNEVVQTVQDRFYDPTLRGLDWQAVVEKYRPLAATAISDEERSAVINRLLAELTASHTRHYTPSEPAYYQLLDIFAGALRRDLRRVFPTEQVAYAGIGAFTQQIGDKTFITGVLGGLPAAKVGLVVGDELLSADGAPYHPIRSFATRVDQEVTLQIRRVASGPVQEVVVVPQWIRPNEAFLHAMEASARIIDTEGTRVGYIHVWSYAGARYQQLLEHELSAGTLKDAEALVLDLRDGWGGAQAHYLDLFNHRAPTMTLVDRQGRASMANVKWRKPVALLVNGGTRSGKEILAHGFKTYGLGELVGTPTAGAVLAGRAFLLSDGSLLLLAVADVLVDGQRLEGTGVEPTITVPFAVEYAQGKDPQLDRAVALLSRSVRG
ncbi:MAG TPA: S41 family peptidase [Candidatus Tectomicrobia bacterium]|jgi:carboxyl-terminal processing protease